MPWKERYAMDMRHEFVVRAMAREMSFAALCREYGVAEKTGYKWVKRYDREGFGGLGDRSRRPRRSPEEVGEGVVCEIVRLKHAHMGWGPRKIREVYARKHGGEEVPSESSFKRVLDRAGLVEKRRRRLSERGGRLTDRRAAEGPNDVWTVDFKGYWYMPDGERCAPLTVRDDYSRYVLCAAVPADARTQTVRAEFEKLFRRYGLPARIRSDNGSPFASRWAPLGLSRLSAWWVVLGIDLDRITPGRPSENGGHERMHRDIAHEVERHKTGDLKSQVAALEVWRESFNRERPHEALGMRCPAEVYVRSDRRYHGTPDCVQYPDGYLQRRVSASGQITIEGLSLPVTQALAGWDVGLKPEGPASYTVHFGRLCLGLVDLGTESFHAATPVAPRIQPDTAGAHARQHNTSRKDCGLDNSTPRVLPMS